MLEMLVGFVEQVSVDLGALPYLATSRTQSLDARCTSQLVAPRVAPLLAEQKNADRAGAILRFVQLSSGLLLACARVPTTRR